MLDKILLYLLAFLIVITGIIFFIGWRYEIKHFFLTIWYGKDKYRDIKTVKYTQPMFGKWNDKDVEEFKQALNRLRESGFGFRGEIKRTARQTIRSLNYYGKMEDIKL